jgi:hypothetical protein
MSKTILAQVDGFTPLIDSLVDEYGVIGAAIFGRIWRYCQGKQGECTAPMSQIGKELDLDKSTISRYVARLVSDQYLEDLTPDAGNTPHTYRDTGKAGLQITLTAKPKSVAQNNRALHRTTERCTEQQSVAQNNTHIRNIETKKQEILAAPPQSVGTLPPTHAPCPRCKLPVRILSSGGLPCAWCLTCEVDALAEVTPEIESEATRAFGYFKHEFKRRRGEFPHLTKGKDFSIIKGLVRDYGRLRVESLMRGYFDLTDDYVRNAGYSVAFFSTRINALLVATNAETRDCSACGKDGLPTGFVRTERGAAPCTVCNFGVLNGKANRQIEASAM